MIDKGFLRIDRALVLEPQQPCLPFHKLRNVIQLQPLPTARVAVDVAPHQHLQRLAGFWVPGAGEDHAGQQLHAAAGRFDPDQRFEVGNDGGRANRHTVMDVSALPSDNFDELGPLARMAALLDSGVAPRLELRIGRQWGKRGRGAFKPFSYYHLRGSNRWHSKQSAQP